MSPRALIFFFFATAVSFFFAAPLHGTLSNGQRYALSFVDVDGHTLSTADGHITVLVLATTGDSDKARSVGDRVPDYCLGNPSYRLITILHFTNKHTGDRDHVSAASPQRRGEAASATMRYKENCKYCEKRHFRRGGF